MHSKYLTTDLLAKELHISTSTLGRMREDGSGPKFMKPGHRVLYSQLHVQEWLDEKTYKSTSEYTS